MPWGFGSKEIPAEDDHEVKKDKKKKKKKSIDDEEAGQYSAVDTTEGSAPTSPKKKRTAAFSFAKKPTKGDPKAMAEWKLEQERMAREKEEKEGRDHGDDAKKAVFKSEMTVKLMAVLQNPANFLSIMNGKTFADGFEAHYGTTNPIEVAHMVMEDLRDAVKKGTWSVGRLAFFGGAYAALQGFNMFLPPMAILHLGTPLAMINMAALTFFGVIIMTVESSGDTISSNFKNGIKKYCAALDTIWGRGVFYCYVGTTQVLGSEMHAFGYYMLCVGIAMLVIYRMTSVHISEMSALFKDDAEIEAAFAKYAGTDGVMGRSELARLFSDLGVELSHAEMEMMLKRLDPDHDGYIALTELKSALAHHEDNSVETYTVTLPKLDPASGDKIMLHSARKKHPKHPDQSGGVDWNKVKKHI